MAGLVGPATSRQGKEKGSEKQASKTSSIENQQPDTLIRKDLLAKKRKNSKADGVDDGRSNKKKNPAANNAAAATKASEEGEQEESMQEEERAFTVEGYLGKPKGLRQVLLERGLLHPGQKMKLEEMRELLAKCPDFAGEMSKIKAMVHRRGHILLLSPKCHPEVAGVGIEYCWGKSKLSFRRKTNDFLAKNLGRNVLLSLGSTFLPLERVRRFARKTRDYLRVYEAMKKARDASLGALTEHEALAAAKDALAVEGDGYAMTEKMVRERKSHRNIVDIDSQSINSM